MTVVTEGIKQLNWLRATRKTKYINFFFFLNVGDCSIDVCGVSFLKVILFWCYIFIYL